MYNVQNLYGSIAGINSKIYELENYILKPKMEDAGDVETLRSQITHLETQMSSLQSEFDTKMNIINAMKDQMGQLESSITHLIKITNGLSTSTPLPPPPPLPPIETVETQPPPAQTPEPEAEPAAEEVFELVPPKSKGGRRKRS